MDRWGVAGPKYPVKVALSKMDEAGTFCEQPGVLSHPRRLLGQVNGNADHNPTKPQPDQQEDDGQRHRSLLCLAGRGPSPAGEHTLERLFRRHKRPPFTVTTGTHNLWRNCTPAPTRGDVEPLAYQAPGNAAEYCRRLGRSYVPPPALTEAMLLDALCHAIQLGPPLRLTGFPCREEDEPVILRRWLQRGWIWGQKITKAGRVAASAGASPWS